MWTGRAISDVSDISEYIALDNSAAAKRLFKRVYAHVRQLSRHPFSGSLPEELEDSRYRQIIEPPCRVFYEVRDGTVFVLHVIRSEQILRVKNLELPE
jgi:plasmid stabilization system protein ParE